MSKITLDAATAEALKGAEPGTELVGPDGRPVGAIVPPDLVWELRELLDERRQALAEADAEVTLEELQAADAAGGEIPMAEVFKLLEQHGG